MSRLRCALAPLLAALATDAVQAQSSRPRPASDDLQRFFARFERELGERGKAPVEFLAAANDRVWATYEWPEERKPALFDYLRNGPRGAGKGLAALAVAGYHDPAGALVLLDVALAPGTGPATRYLCLNAASCTLSMGDAWFTGNPEDMEAVRGYAEQLRTVAKAAQRTSLGRAHAATLQEILTARKEAKAEDAGGLGMALWHVSAYQLGHLDLGSHEVLAPLLDGRDGAAGNVLLALALATNQDFFGDADPASMSREEREGHHEKACRRAKEWWLAAAKSGLPAPRALMLEGLAATGVDPKDPTSTASLAALRDQFDAKQPWRQFAAYRLLNELAGTHFDLDQILLLDKYAMHPLTNGLRKSTQLQRLRTWAGAWIDAQRKPR